MPYCGCSPPTRRSVWAPRHNYPSNGSRISFILLLLLQLNNLINSAAQAAREGTDWRLHLLPAGKRLQAFRSRITRLLILLSVFSVLSACAKPTANPGGPYSADVGQTLTFDGSKSTGTAGQPLTYAWDFGDGST